MSEYTENENVMDEALEAAEETVEETEEIVEGATVTATCAEGTVTATTDSWGDFWLKDLPDAEWRVEIEKGGKRAALEVSTLEEDKGLGDIPLA